MDPLRLAVLETNLDDEEFLILWRILRKKKRVYTEVFDPYLMTQEEVLSNFRFSMEDIVKLKTLLLIPDICKVENQFACDGLESLCILLRRLSYPNRLSDLSLMFYHSPSQISRIFNFMLDHIFTHFGHLLNDFNQDWIQNNLNQFTRAVNEQGAPIPNCWGFLDGTVRAICRPTYDQQLVYNGHKRIHALKFQSLMCPNGLISNLAGPYEGRRHDAFLLYESGLIDKLRNLGNYCVYGDPAYPLRHPIISPYGGPHLTEDQEVFNKKMSVVRQCVEWGFGKILQIFSFVDFKKNQKLFLQPVGKYYIVSVILTNCHTCLYGSQTSTFFGLDPPSLEDYLIPRN